MKTETGTELFGATYRRGETIFRQGDPGDAMYIIQSGAVEVSQRKNGRERVIAILENGDFFGEMALLQNEFRSATVTAIGHSRLISLTKAVLVDRIKRDPDVCLHLLKKLIERIHRAHRRYRREMLENEGFRNTIADAINRPAVEMPSSEGAQGSDALPEVSGFAKAWAHSRSTQAADDCRRQVDAAEIVFREGDTGDAMFLIVSGSVGISKGDPRDAHLLDTIGPGDFFGEMALITDLPRSATVTALEPTELIVVHKASFLGSVRNQPDLAIAIVKTLILRLNHLENLIAHPDRIRINHRPAWLPTPMKRDRISLSMVSLSTCAGCSAVMLGRGFLSDMLAKASIDFCPMLKDQDALPESDVILVDGVVRLKEDEQKLNEARSRCRHLIAWGTCAAFAGIPALANRFELETVIEESYGTTKDTFAYYFGGSAGTDHLGTYQRNGVELHRRVFAIDSFVKVDVYLPGCPPSPAILLQLLAELSDEARSSRTPPIVCSHCRRKPLKPPIDDHLRRDGDRTEDRCFNSLGSICLGFMTRGGCEAVCPRNGVSCWGCRGPSKKAVAGLQSGEALEAIVLDGCRRRYAGCDDPFAEQIRRIKLGGHFMFDIDVDAAAKLLRIR